MVLLPRQPIPQLQLLPSSCSHLSSRSSRYLPIRLPSTWKDTAETRGRPNIPFHSDGYATRTFLPLVGGHVGSTPQGRTFFLPCIPTAVLQCCRIYLPHQGMDGDIFHLPNQVSLQGKLVGDTSVRQADNIGQ